MKNTGFTIVELIVVILIIGILSASIAPRFFSDNDFKARGIADELITAIRHAQRLSMTRGENHRVIITTTNYTVEKFVAGISTPVRHPDGSTSFSKTFPANIVTTAKTIEFDQLGRPIPNNVATVSLSPFTLTVEQETGYAHIF
ncbi:MAG: prepilin-type N-terminal cleavage/methylation domain-containing protein [Gammaproteobacteria bacterium]|nr:prepilin-type N-terminal cleavage/methylation domain-containing protein [Gammaproteobacteria bacterium]MCW8986708.1 prepilin-type N-terminal cleavage/methylation domain-containing protein [Gammaproteobacteria bacterium]MCW9032510.1 prepilin-type N-terminal cleavage/methylation domain-containing protein [Gammaproteobacteria bacterium]